MEGERIGQPLPGAHPLGERARERPPPARVQFARQGELDLASLYSPRHNNSGWSDVGPPAEYKTSCLEYAGTLVQFGLLWRLARRPFWSPGLRGSLSIHADIQHVIVGLVLCHRGGVRRWQFIALADKPDAYPCPCRATRTSS